MNILLGQPFVCVEQLGYRYAKTSTPALKNISLEIPRGSSFGLLGPNGAGKTTLLSLLTGLLPPQQGDIRIAGFDVARESSRVKALTSLVPQEYAFYLALTGRENLRFFADIYGLSKEQWRERLDYCVEVCRLHEVLDQRAAVYSGGMKRRLNLAIGLLNAPQLLYLDEPTVGIDARSRQVIVSAIQALRAQGTTIIYTSHYMEEIEAICDEIAVIDHGRLIARAPTAQLLQGEGHKQLSIKLTSPLSEAAMQALAPWRPDYSDALQLSLQLRGDVALAEVLNALAVHGVGIEQLQFGVSRLEQIYLKLLEDAQA